MLLASYILFTVFCALPPVAASCGGKLPVARLPGGTQVYGFINETIPLVEQYLGIPFGASTAGAGRFAPPVPATLGATFNATVTPLACPQFNPYTVPGGSTFNTAPVQFSSSANISEDCLSVSVWAPKFVSRSDLGKLPVLIFIYGGGFILGSTAVPYQDPAQWVQRNQEFIVVEFNYRMNVFGFPNAAALTEEPNVGLLDQRLAVEWIRDNIVSFGGDPDNMTLWGQSAGAASVDAYSYAWADNPIVKRLIMNSGGTNLITAVDPTHANFTSLAATVGCGNLTAVPELVCMRNVSLDTMIQAFLSGLAKGISFGPVPDDKTVFSNYTKRALEGRLANISAIVGTNANEDAQFTVPITCTGLANINNRQLAGQTVYRYYYAGNFTNVVPSGDGAIHTAELPLLFGTHPDYRGNSTAFEYAVSEVMQDSWYGFVSQAAGGLAFADWAPYTTASPNTRTFGMNRAVAQTLQGNPLDANC